MLSEDTGVTERRVRGAGVELAVFERGDPANPTVLLVHGFPDTHEMWDLVAGRLAERFHVVAYDVRGAGASSAPRPTREYRMDLLLEDLAAVIDATAPGEQIHLVGHDWGSMQGWDAVCHPILEKRFASYTSMGAPALDHSAAWIRARLRRPTPRGLWQLFRQGLASIYILAFRLPGARLVWRRNARLFTRYVERVEHVDISKDYPAATLATDASNGVNLYRAIMGKRMRRPLHRKTNVPVQLIVLMRDRYATPPLFDGIEQMAADLARREIDAGHWAPRTHPHVIADLIASFAAAHAREAA